MLLLLTTNRPDILEPALASRLAVEVPLPDAQCRHRLLELYARGLPMRLTSWDDVVRQTEGASAAFIRELMRRAALLAADGPEEAGVTPDHLAAALHELVFDGGPLTRSLLGARVSMDSSPHDPARGCVPPVPGISQAPVTTTSTQEVRRPRRRRQRGCEPS